jgi:VanZ family protein
VNDAERRTDLVTGRRERAARGAWLVAILVVVVGSLLPAASLPMRMLDRLQISDKIQHFGAYAVLAFLPAVHERWKLIAVAGFGLMALGYGLEVGQLYSPGRSYDLADFAADAVGVCCGVILAIPLRGAVRSLFGIQPD